MAIKRKFPPRVATVYCSGGCRAKKDEDGALPVRVRLHRLWPVRRIVPQTPFILSCSTL